MLGVRRRQIITLLGGASAAWPLAARAQVSSKRALIAWLGASRREPAQAFIDNFLRGMRDPPPLRQ
jgi:putative ABC transport system substrate-binding protein